MLIKDENLALFELVAVFATAALFYLLSLPLFLSVSLVLWLGYLVITIVLVSSQQRQGFLEKIGMVWPPWNKTWGHYLLMASALLVFIIYGFSLKHRSPKIYQGSNFKFTLLLYPLYGLAQLFFFQSIITRRLKGLIHDSLLIVIGALLFSAFHLRDCCELLLLTLVLGGYYTYFYLNHKSILPLALFHGIFATVYYYLFRQVDVMDKLIL